MTLMKKSGIGLFTCMREVLNTGRAPHRMGTCNGGGGSTKLRCTDIRNNSKKCTTTGDRTRDLLGVNEVS